MEKYHCYRFYVQFSLPNWKQRNLEFQWEFIVVWNLSQGSQFINKTVFGENHTMCVFGGIFPAKYGRLRPNTTKRFIQPLHKKVKDDIIWRQNTEPVLRLEKLLRWTPRTYTMFKWIFMHSYPSKYYQISHYGLFYEISWVIYAWNYLPA